MASVPKVESKQKPPSLCKSGFELANVASLDCKVEPSLSQKLIIPKQAKVKEGEMSADEALMLKRPDGVWTKIVNTVTSLFRNDQRDVLYTLRDNKIVELKNDKDARISNKNANK